MRSERALREALLDLPVPEAREAEERALTVARAAYSTGFTRQRPHRRVGARRALQVAVAIGLIAALISPAGAAVRHWVRDAVEPGHTPSQPALTSLPTAGDLLVDSARGPWVVHQDGSKRLLGSYRQSAWSPHGLYVAAADTHQLLAVDPGGEVRWSLSRSGPVTDPAWAPDGQRIAYLDGRDLRVVAGDGTGDRLLADGVAAIAPSWRRGGPRVLTYLGEDGLLWTVRAGTRQVVFQAPAPRRLLDLSWSPDGSRLLLLASGELQMRNRHGAVVRRIAPPAGSRFRAASLSPRGDSVAAVLETGSGSRGELLLYRRGLPAQSLFEGPGVFDGVEYSPDGRWLLLAWSGADQWLFLDQRRPRHVVAVSDIAAQFDPGTTAAPSFPSVSGWCCP